MKTIVAYCRTAPALDSDQSSGITRQVNEILRYAADKGLTIHETYLDASMSGISFDRPELQRLLADCRAGKIDTVLTTDPERLFRDMGQLFALLDVFQKTGVRFAFTTSAGQTRLAFLTVLLSTLAELGAPANA
jgi:DNA invertase Pin-like site-specific DNA recombinase